MSQRAATRPAIAPAAESISDSIMSCRTMSAREAPRARRTAISRDRCAVRANVRLARLAQPVSRTRPTAPSRT